ncbi:5'-nucleotidase, lipoprotein e(P4) family [Flavobacterium algicola]|uniref:5'-nucleotidase, lipoprotein e(P4) family n=1 Tax=Flavobacterium algicola TaxID=556529 RepID=UPI001EFDD692|nr:5'-nucleotidase, lipoprotein e(P4) family [Flavobacterium algicola]MCG9791950.1 5'-nucleotidase, lipoprotein e(P4) family [Flavobacterium algicola]
MKIKFCPNLKKSICILFLVLSVPNLQAQDKSNTYDESQMKAYSILWQQTAAEYRALCYQAFNLASVRLKEIPRRQFRKGNLAIITDLDETILDNSYVGAQLIKEHKQMNGAEWDRWTAVSKATEVPGAVAFLKEASKKGITIFYVSNRDTASVENTLIDLKRLELPNADAAHCLFKTDTSSKEIRRKKIEENYKIVMLMGDNLTDFSTAFEKNSIQDRFDKTDLDQKKWGDKFIVLPNCNYGEWENALYNYERKSDDEKVKMRMELLKGF